MELQRKPRAAAILFAASIAAVVAALFAAGPAAAQKTEMYAAFSKCPTTSPVMNDPANIGSACLSAIVRNGSVRLGNVGAPLTSPMHLQVALVGREEVEGLIVVPGSTVLEGAPATLPNPFLPPEEEKEEEKQGTPEGSGSGGNTPPSTGTPPATTPPAPAPVVPKKHHKKKHHKKKHHKKKRHHGKSGSQGRGKGGNRSQKGWSSVRSLMSRAADEGHPSSRVQPVLTTTPTEPPNVEDLIQVFVEPAGDMRSVNISAVAGEAGTAFELPVKMHMVGKGLGSQCYIGSDAEPIIVAPSLTVPSNSLILALDPNEFPVEVVGVGGESLEDKTLTVPAATGCGELPGSLDAAVNSLIGLPAASGSSQVVFGDVLLELVGAETIEGGPQGGEILQEAFEAAKG